MSPSPNSSGPSQSEPPGPQEQPGGAGALAAALEDVLARLLAEHESLLVLTRAQRAAISSADAAALAAATGGMAEVAARIAELEARRSAITARLGGEGPAPASGAPAPAPLARLAGLLPAAARERVLALAGRLKELLLTLQREQRVIREAAAALAGHLDGLIKQVGRSLAHSGTYGPRGLVAAPVQVVSALDLRS
ncbi:MAG TPA: flagellar export chaperone FlgN [Phycisphaerales bacterium]|nr:flagellar export chaperone FlgN [Phycisphaerales bacterium]